MPDHADSADDFAGRSLRLETLVSLRWLAVAGQTVAVLFVYYILGFPLPLGLCLTLIALSAWLNMALRLRYPASRAARLAARRCCCSPTTSSSSAGCST